MVKVQKRLKIKEADHFHSTPTTLSKLITIDNIRKKLTTRQVELFRETCLGHFLDIQELSPSSNLVHYMLLHEVHTGDADQEMWFLVGGNTIRFSRVEFALITGLKFGTFPLKVNGSDRLEQTYFGKSSTFSLENLDEAFAKWDFDTIDDLDAVRLSLLYLTEWFLFGRGYRNQVDTWLLWDYKNYKEKLTACQDWKGGYNLEGCPIAFQVWIYEAVSIAGKKYATKLNNRIPRILRWKSKTKSISRKQLLKLVFNKEADKGKKTPDQHFNGDDFTQARHNDSMLRLLETRLTVITQEIHNLRQDMMQFVHEVRGWMHTYGPQDVDDFKWTASTPECNDTRGKGEDNVVQHEEGLGGDSIRIIAKPQGDDALSRYGRRYIPGRYARSPYTIPRKK
ncbi:Phospholipase-like protein [Melia azedarach]|uniref:Phospholipase-like protein n=1 Tax=Melia azedarach TaxID=155640 RepID=A0ACC1YTQ1_MELAZ|nr:Phospholipase-like protein [Melia azedarach]